MITLGNILMSTPGDRKIKRRTLIAAIVPIQ